MIKNSTCQLYIERFSAYYGKKTPRVTFFFLNHGFVSYWLINHSFMIHNFQKTRLLTGKYVNGQKKKHMTLVSICYATC